MSLGGAHLCSSSGERRTRLLLSSAPSTSCLDGRGGGGRGGWFSDTLLQVLQCPPLLSPHTRAQGGCRTPG